MTDSEIPGYSIDDLETIISEGLDPIYEATEYDARATVYKIADRLILDWSAMEGSMCGTSVLKTNSIKAAKETADYKAWELASDAGVIFDRCLCLDLIAEEDRLPVPDGALRVGSRVLHDSYSRHDLVELIIYEHFEDGQQIFLVETAEDGLVIGEFASLDQIDSQIQRPVAFSIESRD